MSTSDKTVSARVSSPELARLDKIADSLGWSRSQLLREIIFRFISDHSTSSAIKELLND